MNSSNKGLTVEKWCKNSTTLTSFKNFFFIVCFVFLSNATSWANWSFREVLHQQMNAFTTVTAPSVEVCEGQATTNITLDPIVIDEGAIDNFKKTTGTQTVIFSFGSNITLDGGNLTSNLTNSGTDASAAVSVNGDGNLQIDYDFKNGSLSTTSILTIDGLKVSVPATVPNGVYKLTVSSGAEADLSLDTNNDPLATVTVSAPAATPTIIYGPTSLFKGETAVYSVPIVAGVDSYEWTLPNELTSVDGNVNESFVVVTAQSAISVATISVVARKNNGCNSQSFGTQLSINDRGLSVSSENTTLCDNQQVISLPDIVLAEKFYADFANNNGTLFLEFDDNAKFDFEPVTSDSKAIFTTSTGQTEFNIVREDANTLKITYDFTNSQAELNSLIIKGIKVKAEASSGSGFIKMKSANTHFSGITTSTELAKLSIGTSPVATGISFNSPLNSVCTNTDVIFDITDATNTGVTYEWQLPTGMSIKNTTANSVTVEVSSGAMSGDIEVRAINSSGCVSPWVTHAVTVSTTPQKPTAISGDDKMCLGNTKFFYVATVSGADKYEWEVPAGTLVSADDNDPLVAGTTVDVITTSNSFINLTSIKESTTALDIKVRGVSNTCGNGEYSEVKSITIDAAPTVVISGVTDGQSFTTTDTPITLSAAQLSAPNTPLGGGTFSGIGVSGNQFSPSAVTVSGSSTTVPITYAVNLPGEDCPSIARVNVIVSTASDIPGVSSVYCQGATDVADFQVQRIFTSNLSTKFTHRYIVGLKTLPGLTAGGASSGPFYADLSNVPACNTSAPVTTPTHFTYTFTPGGLPPGKYPIQAYVVTVYSKDGIFTKGDSFNTLNTLTGCSVSLQTLTTVTIEPAPTPAIRTTAGVSICADNTTEYTYSIVPEPDHTYKWEAGYRGRIVGSDVNDVVKVVWEEAGSRQLKVTATNTITGCKGEEIIFEDVKAVPAPSIVGRVDGNNKTEACAYATVVYKGNTGGSAYDWSVTNGSILPPATGQAADEVRVAWLNQPGKLTLSTTNSNGCTASTELDVSINTASDANLQGPDAVCANAQGVEYTISTPAVGDVINWTVTGAQNYVVEPDGSKVTVDWGTKALGTVSVKKTSNGCEGTEEMTVEVNALPVAEITNVAPVYCATELTTTFQPTVNGEADLSSGTGVYILEKDGNVLSSTNLFNGNDLKIADLVNAYGTGAYTVKYEFTVAAGGCQDVSSPQTFEIIAKPEATFTGIAQTGEYCASDNLVLNPSLAGGFFTIVKLDGNNAPITNTSKDFPVDVSQANTSIPLNTLLGDGLGFYQVIYTYRNSTGCEDISDPTTFKINPLPTVVIDTDNISDNYCIQDDSFTFSIKVGGVAQWAFLNENTLFFEIRRVSGTRTPTDFEVMIEDKNSGNTGLSRRFNPKRPLYSEATIADNAPTAQWNALAGVYEVRYTYTDGKGCQKVSEPYQITLKKLPVIAFTGLQSFYCKAVTSAIVNPSVDGVAPSANNLGLFRIYKDGIELTSFAGNEFNPAGLNKLGNFTITYEYQNGDGCKTVTPEKPFTIGEAIVPTFSFANPTPENKYCIKGNNITVVPDAANVGGTFSVTTPKGDVIPLDGNVIEVATLPEIGIYYVTYTFNDSFGCTGTSTPQPFQIVPLPAITIKGINNSGEYCVQTTELVTLIPEITVEGSLLGSVPNLDASKAYFEVKRISGVQGATNYVKMVTAGTTTLTDKFNPRRPLPDSPEILPDAPTSVWNQVVGEYAVRYIYEDGNGCKKISAAEIIKVTPLPQLSFTGLNASYCDDVELVTLTPFDGESKISSGIVFKYKNLSVAGSDYVPFNQGFSFSPKNLAPGEYEIVLESTAVGCSNSSNRDSVVTVTIEPTPKNIRIVASRDYNQSQVSFSATADGVNNSWTWSWDFKDGTTSQEQNPTKQLATATPSVINYELIPSTELGCNASVSKRFKIDFDLTGHCVGGVTKFTNLSELPGDTIGNVSWDFGDGQGTSTEMNPGYTYQNPGTYWVTLSVQTTDGVATYKLRRRLDIFPVVTVNTEQFYVEGFENGTAGWISHGVVEVDRVNVDATSWTLKNPDGFVITNPDGNAWVTDNRSNPNRVDSNANYNNNEQSYVESPCFDIGGLNKPMISFSYWSDTDLGGDGVSLLYTIDDGKTWHRLGTGDLGINWYNTKPILGAPGTASSTVNVNSNPDSQGWSGKLAPVDGKWQIARYSLTEVLIKMEAAGITNRVVRFRMSFGSNADNTPNAQFDGFAFDNIIISNRNRLVLLEYFINTGINNAAQHDLQANNFPQTGNKNEIVKIHHHTAFPAVDSLNEVNPKDPSARAFHHGIREVPRGIIDGYFRDTLIGQWTQDIFADRTLIPAPFKIDVANATTSAGQLNISTEIKALLAFDRKIVINVVVVDSAATAGNETYYNVTRKMLPDAAGTYRSAPWALGDTQKLDLSWDYGNLDPSGFKVVVFIEDYETKEIWQAGEASVSVKRQQEGQTQQEVTGVEDELLMEGAVVYPNPTTNRLNVAIKAPLSPKAQWQIWSVTGRLVKQGSWTQGKRRIAIDVQDLAGGLYILRVADKGKTSQLRFEKH